MIFDFSIQSETCSAKAWIWLIQSACSLYHKFPDWLQIILNSGISAGSITAILLNLFLNGSTRSAVVGTPDPAEPEADRAEDMPTRLGVDVE